MERPELIPEEWKFQCPEWPFAFRQEGIMDTEHVETEVSMP